MDIKHVGSMLKLTSHGQQGVIYLHIGDIEGLEVGIDRTYVSVASGKVHRVIESAEDIVKKIEELGG